MHPGSRATLLVTLFSLGAVAGAMPVDAAHEPGDRVTLDLCTTHDLHVPVPMGFVSGMAPDGYRVVPFDEDGSLAHALVRATGCGRAELEGHLFAPAVMLWRLVLVEPTTGPPLDGSRDAVPLRGYVEASPLDAWFGDLGFAGRTEPITTDVFLTLDDLAHATGIISLRGLNGLRLSMSSEVPGAATSAPAAALRVHAVSNGSSTGGFEMTLDGGLTRTGGVGTFAITGDGQVAHGYPSTADHRRGHQALLATF